MAETILMIHGMWGGAWCWENYERFFEDRGYHCVPTTLRFHDIDPNEAPDPRLGTTSILDYVLDLEVEIRQLGAKPIVIGHSMGALLSQILGSRQLAKALVLLAPGAPAGIMTLGPSVISSFWSAMVKWGFWKTPMRQTFQEAAHSMLHLLSPEEQTKTYERFVYESGRVASEMGFWFLDSHKTTTVDESKVTCPVLVVRGADDRMARGSISRQVAEKYKTVATYKEFANHAHWIVAEPGWQTVAEYVAGWLDRVLGEAG